VAVCITAVNSDEDVVDRRKDTRRGGGVAAWASRSAPKARENMFPPRRGNSERKPQFSKK
jgi:hypothetical protein